jgi:mannose-1-phosphate guanylyltransferase / mannose-6-phosphate isomerase
LEPIPLVGPRRGPEKPSLQICAIVLGSRGVSASKTKFTDPPREDGKVGTVSNIAIQRYTHLARTMQKFIQSSIRPVILCGGSGARLWPLSRAMYPKQFIRFFDYQGSSFLASTLKRVAENVRFASPIIVSNNDHRFLVKEEAAQAGVSPHTIVLEPVSRNTAPAAAVAALLVARDDPDGTLVVMPSDHFIKDERAFVNAVQHAAKVAAGGKLVLFGIKPDGPHAGFGYIRRGAAIEGFADAFIVDAFLEKPSPERAAAYISEGGYYWNSGVFVFRARAFLDELARRHPATLHAARQALENAREDIGFLRLERVAFEQAANISIDYAIMEHTRDAAVVPVDMGWSDVGSWTSLWEIGDKDQAGNVVRGEAMLDDTTNCYVHSERPLVSTLGVKDLVIVATQDALLVADRARAQDVASIVAHLKATGRREHAHHVRCYRPWGYFETLSTGPRFQVKLLYVKPGERLSLQMHHHRSEHWVVVHGTAKVTIGDVEKLIRENESVYIFATQWHRLDNPGKTPLQIIEVQIGSYLGEDDIVRSQDVYNRNSEEAK